MVYWESGKKNVCGGNVEMQGKERNLVGKMKIIHRECVYALREKRMIPLSENVHHIGHSLLALSWMLGSKDLGFYVFRTLICIVGKP